jgi:hypothetical protein
MKQRQRSRLQELNNMKNKFVILAAVSMLVACKANTGFEESNDFSGLYTLGVTSGSIMTNDAAFQELSKFCGQTSLEGYVARIAKKLSFNAGYANHPNSGYDAEIVRKMGPDGKEAFYIGNGEMFTPESRAMDLPTNGSISELVAGYCTVVMNSLKGGGGCAYPTVEVSQGGSVSGSSARGSINSSSCITAKLQNQQIKHRAEFAFCPDALGLNFFTSSDGAAGEMSAIIRSGG